VNSSFYPPVTVAESVDCFDVTPNSSIIEVVFSDAKEVYIVDRDDDSRVWNTPVSVATAASDITSISIDYKSLKTVIAYTTTSAVEVLENPSDISIPAISFSGIPSDVKIRMLDDVNYDIIFNDTVAAKRSIQHVAREGATFWTSQIIDNTVDNYNIDLFEGSKVCVVWNDGSYVRYREKSGYTWVGLDDSAYVSACDVDSTPKVIYYHDYSRVIYKLSGFVYYAGMTPTTNVITANFNCSIWGGTKLIDDSNTSISSSLVENRISQRVTFQQRDLSVGNVSCYLKKCDTSGMVYTVSLDMYYSDINGNPYSDPIASVSLLSSDIPSAGWGNFYFNLTGLLVPVDGYCFVMRQVGGDENNYTSWLGYRDSGKDARISKDGTSWVLAQNITRSLRISGNFNAFEKIINDDPSKITHQLITVPATASEGVVSGYNDLSDGTFDNTYLINVKEPSYYQYPELTYYVTEDADKGSKIICLTTSEASALNPGDQIYITNNQNVMQYNYVISVEDDGCITVRDELITDYTVSDDSRIIVPIVTEYVNQRDRIYGYSTTNTDWRVAIKKKNTIVSFVVDSSGSMGWNDVFGIRKKLVSNIISRLGGASEMQVSFDFVKFGGLLVDNITTSFEKKVKSVSVDINTPSSIYGYDPDGNPITDTDPKKHLSSGVIAFGYKGLKDGCTYIIKGIDLGTKTYYDTGNSVSNKWHSLWVSSSPDFSMHTNGPDSASCLNVSVSDPSKNLVRYYAAGYDGDFVTRLVNPINPGDLSVDVVDAVGFDVSTRVNILDENYINRSLYVSSSDVIANSIGFSGICHYDMSVDSTRVESTDSNYIQSGWGSLNSINFYIVEATQSGSITFFVQTSDGATIEYDVTPMQQWELYSLYYLDETARFDINAVNSKGENITDGTMVEYYVNMNPPNASTETETVQEEISATKDCLSGSTVIYLSSGNISKFSRGDKVELTDDSKQYGASVTEAPYFGTIIEVNKVNNFLVVSPAIVGDFLLSRNIRFIVPATKQQDNTFFLRTKFDIAANLVNVTPIYTGEKLPDSFFGDIDPPQVEPTDTYDQYNSDPTRVVRNSTEVLTTNGYSALRLLPITEDGFLTEEVRIANSLSLFAKTAREQYTDDASSSSSTSSSPSVTSSSSSSSSSKEYYSGEKDFVMENPVYVYNGLVFTTMKSNATSLVETEIGGLTYLAKQYLINPVMTFFKEDGTTIAQMMLPSYDVSFACPVRMLSEATDSVGFECIAPGAEGEPPTTYEQLVCGTYALSGTGVQVTYKVDYKNFPMSSGNLLINIYDARRNKSTAYVLDQDLGDVSGCGDTLSLSGGESKYYAVQSDGYNPYDAVVSNKLLASDFFTASFSIPVVDGVATLTLPAVDRISQFEIHAIYQISSAAQVVHVQNVYYRSPLVLTYTGPLSLVNDGNATYNLSATASWMKIYPVDDGTIVNFSTSGGELNPSISETIGGVAQGVILRPLAQNVEPVTTSSSGQDISDSVKSQSKVQSRSITVESTYRGFYAKISATLEVQQEDDSQQMEKFYFVARGFYSASNDSNFFADGVDYVMVVADLQESYNRAFPFMETTYDYIKSNKTIIVFSGSGLTPRYNTVKWQVPLDNSGDSYPPSPGVPTTGTDAPAYAWNMLSSNKFIGRPKMEVPSNTDGPPPCNSPSCIEISSHTRVKNEQGGWVLGQGIDSATISFTSETLGGNEKIPKPRVSLKEPLGLDLSFEPVDRSEYQSADWRQTAPGQHISSYSIDQYSHPLRRDGQAKFYAVAEVTWRDSFVRNAIDNPFPSVNFASGKFEEESDENGYSYSFTQDNVFKLDADISTASISRTTFDENHFHVCYVDDSGVGQTTETVSSCKGIIVPDHVHSIDINNSVYISMASYSIQTVDGEGNLVTVDVNHNHKPRSVAIVSCGPVADLNSNICVRGVVTYDNGKIVNNVRTVRTLDNYTFSSPEAVSGTTPTTVYEKKYLLEIITPTIKSGDKLISGMFTSLSKDAAGQTIAFRLRYQNEYGELVPVDNGTRIFVSFKFFEPPAKPGQEDKKDILVIEQGKITDYAVMEIAARVSDLPVEVLASKQVLIESIYNWYPSVSDGGFSTITTDPVYLNNAIDSITEFGGSQISDALIYASNRIIETGSDYLGWSKVIILISDGSENMSENSNSQAVDSVESINGDGKTTIFSVKLSDTDGFDAVVMQKLALNTDGDYFKVGEISGDVDDTANQIVDSILGSDKFGPLVGTYTNIVDLGETKTYTGITLGVLMLPGTKIKLRVRFSVDAVNYDDWTDLPIVTYGGIDTVQWIAINVDGMGRYMQYEATLLGDVNTFFSPQIAGLSYQYNEPGRYTLFFQPISIEKPNHYVGEVMFTHEGDIPDTSTIRYGITHDVSTDFTSWFSSVGQPKFKSGISAFVLSRYNEKTTTNDYKTYVAVNGGWNDSYTVDVYKISSEVPKGELVAPSLYITNNKTGTIIFGTQQPESVSYTIVVGLRPYFRFAIETVNYSTETITLDNLSVSYNLVDREKLSLPNDHRDVSSLIHTNYEDFVVSPETWKEGVAVLNSSISKDTDKIIDLTYPQVSFTVTMYNGTRVFMVDMLANFVVTNTYELSGGPDFLPVSSNYDSGFWYFVERTASGCLVHKYQLVIPPVTIPADTNAKASYEYIYTSSYTFDFLQNGDTFLGIRRDGIYWYVTESDRIHVLNRSFVYDHTILLPFSISGLMAKDGDNFWLISQKKDFVWNVDKNGTVLGGKKFELNETGNNLSYIQGKAYIVKSNYLSQFS
jgi:hypothetical protein